MDESSYLFLLPNGGLNLGLSEGPDRVRRKSLFIFDTIFCVCQDGQFRAFGGHDKDEWRVRRAFCSALDIFTARDQSHDARQVNGEQSDPDRVKSNADTWLKAKSDNR